MPRRWLVNTSNNRLVGVIDDDDAAVPAGREGVAQNVITATGVTHGRTSRRMACGWSLTA